MMVHAYSVPALVTIAGAIGHMVLKSDRAANLAKVAFACGLVILLVTSGGLGK
jgi:uncharacterized membrane protein YtjA (UPF0391 family)